MRLETARVISQDRVAEDTYLMWLAAPPLATGAAGRFLMIRCGEGDDPLLPRPMSYHRFRVVAGETQFAILYDVRGRGTEWLARRQSGDEIRAFGPLGHGVTLQPDTRNLLLVAGGIGIAALPPLMDEMLAKGGSVTLLQGARTAAKLLPTAFLPAEVEVVSATEDGSLGRQGRAPELLPEYLSWADQVVACGPNPMFEAMARVIKEVRGGRTRRSVQVIAEEHMACGTGICYGCAMFTPKGVRLVCKDGPAFELNDVFR